MEPSERELAAHFAAMEDEVLLEAALSRNELTEFAQDFLVSEVRSRRLILPVAAVVSDAMDPTPETRIVTLRKFSGLQEGMIARSALESTGIACFLRDEHTVTVATHLTNMLGGARLDVREADWEAAEAVLLRLETESIDAEALEGIESLLGAAYLCPSCQSDDVNRVTPWWGFHTIASWIIGRRLPQGDQKWRCNHCKTIWIDNDRD